VAAYAALVVGEKELARKPVEWVASSRAELKAFPPEVRFDMAYAILLAQDGKKHPDAKPLLGFGGAGVLEFVDDYDGNTYRPVYTVKFEEAVYVLHAFQKKSKSGSATPKLVLDLIRRRLKAAEGRHAELLRAAQR
jgi:phage-related protein